MYSSTVTQYREKKQSDYDHKTEEDVEPIPLQKEIAAVEQPIIWRNVIGIIVLHLLAIYGFVSGYRDAKLYTWIWSFLYGIIGGIGVTAGAHRLWAHRSYSAKVPLKIFLACLYCTMGQTHFYKWIRDHRTHHRHTETSADPHDSNRGFFFSHIGWLMMKRHPAVIEYGRKIDMSDISADAVIRFFDTFYEPIMLFFCFVLPTLLPVYVWHETWFVSTFAVIIRYVTSLHMTFSVNSFAHMWGNRPYNRVKPVENPTVSFVSLGEGWHNYHHSFPWDYKAAELGAYGLNGTTAFIELMAWLGLAYNLKTPSKDVVDRTTSRKGDGTDSLWGHSRNKK